MKERTTITLFAVLFAIMGIHAQAVAPMLKSLWHQGYPFNKDIPNRVNAGCGPIAVAQILNYYQYPVHGYGHVTLYNDLDYSMHTIDWDNIINTYDEYNEVQANAVANLVWHVGAAMTLKYPNNGTDNNRMIWGLQKYLHISPKCRFRLRKFYSTEQWLKMLDEQLASGHPVYYRGRAFRYGCDPSGIGHIFVIDGKNEEGLYHFNFGHANKEQDKYTSLDVINQSADIYPGDYGIYYNWEQGMATDLYPDEYFNEEEFNDYPVYLDEPLHLNYDRKMDELTIPIGETFYLSTKLHIYTKDYFIKNEGGNNWTWQRALGVYHDSKFLTAIYSPQSQSFTISSSISSTLPFSIPASLEDGEYELKVVIRRNDDESWKPVWDIAPNHIAATVNNGYVTLKTMGDHTQETHLYLTEPIKKIGDYHNEVNGILYSMRIKNPTDNNFENNIKFTIKGLDGKDSKDFEQMASVYASCEVEYHFLIPYNEYSDVSSLGHFNVEASYYEHNTNQYVKLTTDVPDISSVLTIKDEVRQRYISIYDTNGRLRKRVSDSIAPLSGLPKGCYVIKQGATTRKVIK
ncbi:MAG: C10 family peptidase [Prevotella sp.]|nr:C10 family peptidase [Prevotella sp.]